MNLITKMKMKKSVGASQVSAREKHNCEKNNYKN